MTTAKTAMRRKGAARTTTPRTTLTVIEGALSIYRPGDRVTYENGGERIEVEVESTFIRDGALYVNVIDRLYVAARIITRVERPVKNTR